jgi:hypothetical protein
MIGDLVRLGRVSFCLILGAAALVGGVVGVRGADLRGADSREGEVAEEQRRPATLESLVEMLKSAKYQEREEATQTLMRWPVQRRSEIEQALSKETDLEAITRLTRVAVHMMLKGHTSLDGPVSLLGITLTVEGWREGGDKDKDKDKDAGELRAAVVVTGVQPGFPAAEVLQAGDRIVAVDGKPFDAGFTFEDFRGLVGRQHAGTIMQMTVVRSGKAMRVGVRLAGLSEAEMMSVTEFVGQRLRQSAEYVKSLKTGLSVAPAVIKDDSGPEPELNERVEFEDQ